MDISVTNIYDESELTGDFSLELKDLNNSVESSYRFLFDYDEISELNTKISEAINIFNSHTSDDL